ncbi:MarR family winged helix-turn-helix transcriptional regulator [Streptomyces murinus]|uniref:MarR family winged helix-turn-helix transcriptional regulator n=1 Tax=Streptomyces murinus TaxID=33900 RepID=UPI002113C286|nr:MarR family transcriptional regulator [Streptomyces murinus]
MSDRRNNLHDTDQPTADDRSPTTAGAQLAADQDRRAAEQGRGAANQGRKTADRGRKPADPERRAADHAGSAAHDQPVAHDQSAAPGDIGAEEISQAADALFFAMRRARTTSAEHYGGLSLPQVALLEPLATEQDLPVGRLASSADVSVPTATRMLQQLETKGIVVRRRSPEDERRVLVSLTDDGAERLAVLRGHLRERQARAYEAFTPAERALLVTLLHRLTDLVADPGTS